MHADEKKAGYVRCMETLDALEENRTDTNVEAYRECRACFVEARDECRRAGRMAEALEYDARIEKLDAWILDAERNLEKRIRITEDRHRIAEQFGYPPPNVPWRYDLRDR